jgi:Uma2 family endonuclease
MAIAGQRLTLEEFLALPDAEPALELIDGTVTQKLAPKGYHSRLQPMLAEFFRRYAEPRGLGIAFTELRSSFAGSAPIPDVSLYRWERIPWQPDGRLPNDFTEPPDIAVEIVSPEQSRADLIAKCEWYVAHGVPLVVLVDPDDLSVVLLRPGAAPVDLRGADVMDFAPVLPGLRLSVRRLFGWLDPRPRGRRRGDG